MADGQANTVEESLPEENWHEFGLEPAGSAAWKALGFGPFEAAMAHGDGYTPSFIVHHTRPIQKLAAAWRGAGLGSPEGLRWHIAGFSVDQALEWRRIGVDVEEASRRRWLDPSGPHSPNGST